MEAHGLDLKGKIFIEEVAVRPTWTSSDKRRIIYVTNTDKFYFGGSADWIDLSVSSITDPELLAIMSLTSAADKFPYFTGSGTASQLTIVSAIRTVLEAADVSAMRTAMNLGSAALVNTGTGTADVPTNSSLTKIKNAANIVLQTTSGGA